MEEQHYGTILLNGECFLYGDHIVMLFKNLTGENFKNTEDHQQYIAQIKDLHCCTLEGELTLLDTNGKEVATHQIIN